MDFELISTYSPTGDQPEAIRQLTDGLLRGCRHQTLLGVTGSGKTFTIANVIANVNRPTLVLSHNKTLAAQLYAEFKDFFPHNAVEYFVSYYDYYQPEAYLPASDTYIEKDLAINDEIEKLRLSTTSALLSGRSDIVVVSTVSCIYGIGNPSDFHNNTLTVDVGKQYDRNAFLMRLVDALYFRSDVDFKRGTFRVRGDTIDIFPAYSDLALRIVFWDDEVEDISTFDPLQELQAEHLTTVKIYPANIFVTTKERINQAIEHIQDDMMKQVRHFDEIGRHLEANRLKNRTEYDMEMIKELGHCSGIENYSRYFDGRDPGSRPFCLLDFFPSDFLTVIDESHVTVPQIGAMFGGDRSRKSNLVDYGFRLPAALDNRPLTFDEFSSMVKQTIYVSATPKEYELEKSEGIVVEQIIRPTGLLDPVIEVRPSRNQIDDLMTEIAERSQRDERILVTTLTKRMAEELTKYLQRYQVRCAYIHSDVDTLERVEILNNLRKGIYDVLVGVNLLREGLDLPEVSLVAVLDADKEGFLRSSRALTQTAGRAARNINGKVIMYADRITDSMQRTIDETNRRREKQLRYNEEHGITPRQIVKGQRQGLGDPERVVAVEPLPQQPQQAGVVVLDPIIRSMDRRDLAKTIVKTKRQMEAAAAKLDFTEAARLRDEVFMYETLLAEK